MSFQNYCQVIVGFIINLLKSNFTEVWFAYNKWKLPSIVNTLPSLLVRGNQWPDFCHSSIVPEFRVNGII